MFIVDILVVEIDCWFYLVPGNSAAGLVCCFNNVY